MTIEILKEIWTWWLKIKKIAPGSDLVRTIEILTYIEEREYSIVSTPFFRFMDVIDKANNRTKEINFNEFLPGLISFCLFTRSEVLGFVFHMVDEDRDERVSKQDIFKSLLAMRAG